MSIAGGASVVDEDTSGIMTVRCCTTVGGGGGLEEVLKYVRGEPCEIDLRYRDWRAGERLEIYSTRKRCALCPTAYTQLRHQSDLFMQPKVLRM